MSNILFSQTVCWGSLLGKNGWPLYALAASPELVRHVSAMCPGRSRSQSAMCPPCARIVSGLYPLWSCLQTLSATSLPCPPCVRLVSVLCPSCVRFGVAYHLQTLSGMFPLCILYGSALAGQPAMCPIVSAFSRLVSAFFCVLGAPAELARHMSAMCPQWPQPKYALGLHCGAARRLCLQRRRSAPVEALLGACSGAARRLNAVPKALRFRLNHYG